MHFVSQSSLFLLSCAFGIIAQSSTSTASSNSTELHSGTATVTVVGSSTVTGASSITSAPGNSSSASASTTSTASWPTLSGVSDCVVTCLMLAVSNSTCSSVTDVDCFCGPKHRSNFTRSIVNCVSTTSGCNPTSDLSRAEDLSQSFCQLSNNTASLTFPTASSTTGSSSTTSGTSNTTSTSATSTSTSPTGSPSPSGTSAASRLGSSTDHTTLLGLLVGTVTVLVGGALL